MNVTTMFFTMIAVMVIIGSVSAAIPTVTVPTAGGVVSSGANQGNVNLYKPCVYCYGPTPTVTPTPIPTQAPVRTEVGIDFSNPYGLDNLPSYKPFTLTAFQTSGPTLSSKATWRWTTDGKYGVKNQNSGQIYNGIMYPAKARVTLNVKDGNLYGSITHVIESDHNLF